MFRIPMKLAAILPIACLLVACAAPQPGERPARAPVSPEQLAAEGRHVEAAEAWLAIAVSRPDERFSARVAAAEQWLAAGRFGNARAVLAPFAATDLDDFRAAELRLMRAEIALLDDRLVDARRLLAIPAERVPEAFSDRYLALRERLREVDPDSPEARVDALERAVGEPGFGPARALSLLIDLPLADLVERRDRNRGKALVFPWLDLASSARRHLTDDPALARALAEWRDRHGLASDIAREAAEWIEAWRETRPMPQSISVLLPGEGPLTRAGNVVRDGMLSRWLEMPSDRRPALDFRYLDQAPDAAVSEFFDVRDGGAEFVIGPLWREQIDPLLALPDPAVPVLLLNRPLNPDRTVRASDPIAVLALPPEEEAELAAVRALVESHERALVVAQDSDFGRRVAERFVETFELGGGRVLAQTRYTPGEFDHTEVLSVLLALDESERRIERLRSLLREDFEAVPQRRTDFDLVFLAARGGDGLQIVPQLRFLELEETPLFATSDIYPGGDIGSDLDGVEFPIAPWSLDTGPSAERRRAATARDPELAASPTLSVLYALGRDAMSLVPWFVAMKEDPALYLAGHVGRLRLADGIVLERDLPWARVVDGEPVRAEPGS
jgi:outer membrane PBP1 activator LpoA protein